KSSLGPNTTVIDCTVPLASEVGGRPTRMLGVWEGSAAQQARSIVGRDVSLASGFHTMMASTLEAIELSFDQHILLRGDPEARRIGRASCRERVGSSGGEGDGWRERRV